MTVLHKSEKMKKGFLKQPILALTRDKATFFNSLSIDRFVYPRLQRFFFISFFCILYADSSEQIRFIRTPYPYGIDFSYILDEMTLSLRFTERFS
jgi:hypothetical protein